MLDWVGGLGSAISVGFNIVGTLTSMLVKPKVKANYPTAMELLFRQLSN